MEGKYDRHDFLLDEVIAKPNDSSLWKHLVQFWPNISKLEHWAVRNGESVKSWKYFWLDKGLRVADLDIDIPLSMQNAKVADLVDEYGD